MEQEIRIIRFPELKRKLGNVSRPTIRRWEKERGFPKGVNIGPRSVGWRLDLVDEWLKEKSEKSA